MILGSENTGPGIGLIGNWVDNCIIRADGDQDNASFQGSLTHLTDTGQMSLGQVATPASKLHIFGGGTGTVYGIKLFGDNADGVRLTSYVNDGLGFATIYAWDEEDGGIGKYADLSLGHAIGTYMVIKGDTGNIGFGIDSPETLIEMTSTVPYFTFLNSTNENGDGERESQIRFKGKRSGSEEHFLAMIQASHDIGDDTNLGDLIFYTRGSGGADVDLPTERMRIDSAGLMTYVGPTLFQNAADSTTAYQWLDADGGTPILNIDSIDERVGIRTAAPAYALDVVAGGTGIMRLGSSHTDATIKFGRLVVPHYMIAEESMYIFGASSTTTANNIAFGGGSSQANAATQIDFFTAANNTTTIGTSRLTITSVGLVGIGTTATEKLTVDGNLALASGWEINNESGSWWQRIITIDSASLTDAKFSFQERQGSGDYISLFTILGNKYIGIGETAPETLLEMTSTAPIFTIHNSTETDAAGGRPCIIQAFGEQSGSEETTLGLMEWAHDGAVNDEKGYWRLLLNDGTDGDSPTERLRILANGNMGLNEVAPQDTLELNGTMLIKDALKFTQDDGNEFLDSLNDGYMDYRATDGHRFNTLIEASGDVVFTGAGSGLPLGCISGIDETVTCTDQSTYYQVTFDTVGPSNLTTVNIINEEITVLKAGVYTVAVTACFHSAVSHDFEFLVKKNDGATALEPHLFQSTAVANKVENTSGSCLVSLDANDRIELWVQCTDAAGQDAIFDHVSLTCAMVGG